MTLDIAEIDPGCSLRSQRESLFQEVFHGLLHNRFLAYPGWSASPVEAPKHLLCVIQCMRLLMRERPFVDLLVQEGGFHTLATLLRSLADSFFQGEHCTYTNQILTEGASIAQKKCRRIATVPSPGDGLWHSRNNVHSAPHGGPGSSPVSNHGSALPLRRKGPCGPDLNNFEVLLHIMQEFGSPFQELSIDLLSTLAKSQSLRVKIVNAGGLACILSQIMAADSKTMLPLLKLLCLMMADEDGLLAVRDSGGIPIVVSLFGEVRTDGDLKTQLINFEGLRLDTISVQCLCASHCSPLTTNPLTRSGSATGCTTWAASWWL